MEHHLHSLLTVVKSAVWPPYTFIILSKRGQQFIVNSMMSDALFIFYCGKVTLHSKCLIHASHASCKWTEALWRTCVWCFYLRFQNRWQISDTFNPVNGFAGCQDARSLQSRTPITFFRSVFTLDTMRLIVQIRWDTVCYIMSYWHYCDLSSVCKTKESC